MSLLKYRGDDGSGSTIHWLQRSETDGAPYRGAQVPMMRDEEFDQHAHRVKDAKVRVFKLWEEKDLMAYQNVVDRCTNGMWTLIRDMPMPIEDKQSFVVFCIWAENYMEVAPEHIDAIKMRMNS